MKSTHDSSGISGQPAVSTAGAAGAARAVAFPTVGRRTWFTEFARVFVKAFHSAIVIAFAGFSIYLMYCAVTGRRDALIVWALVGIAAEAVIYLGFRRKCPLTLLARYLGDDGGHDYLFEWLLGTKRIGYVSRTLAGLAVIGVLMLIVAELIKLA